MNHKIYSIQNFCNTLLSDWVDWNSGLLKGDFSIDATNVTQALGVDTSTGRSRAKEMYRIGLLTMELTKGTQALTNIREGKNIQSRLGYLSGLIYNGYQIKPTEKIYRSIAAICAIFSIIQSFEIGNLKVSINTVFQRLLSAYPCPADYDVFKWMKYLIAGFCCELSYSDNEEIITKFLKGEENSISLRIIENEQVSKKKGTDEAKRIRSVISDTESLKSAIDNRVSLTDIFHQKTPLFSIGSLKSMDPEGYYGLAFKYYPAFLKDCFEIETNDIYTSPFIKLYQDDEDEKCQKPYVLENLKTISKLNVNIEKSYKQIMNTIEAGAVEALSFMTDKPESNFYIPYIPSTEDEKKFIPYFTALRTKPFLLLAGISGTGKSRIVRELAFMSCPSYLQDAEGTTPGNYCMIEVKPNWHDSSELLGYYSNIRKAYVFTKFVKFLVRAMMHPTVPFFVCLDEMNLAPVEQYFAEFLSVLETRKIAKGTDNVATGNLVKAESFTKKIEKYGSATATEYPTDKDWFYEFFSEDTISVEEKAIVDKHADQTLSHKGLPLPENVFVIGTVNMDDTTHQFSRKVIDRAMTIEMNGGKLEDMFGGSKKLEYPTESDDKILSMATLKARYISGDDVLEKCSHIKNDAEAVRFVTGRDAAEGEDTLPRRLDAINKILENTPFQVSYRVFNELVIYLAVLCDDAANEDKDIKALADIALDKISLMKILPRIEGDYDMFTDGDKNKLKQLMELFAKDGGSWKKLDEMAKRLDSTEFTRFWP